MSTQAPPPDPQTVVMVPTLPAPRHAFGWPPGSIRALLVLIVVALFCTLVLVTPRDQRGVIIGIPPYLFYLLFMSVGYYFAIRGHSRELHRTAPPPLWLPTGSIRLIVMAALTASITWKLVHDKEELIEQLVESGKQLREQPLLPLVMLGSFFLGVVIRVVIIGKNERSAWAQDMEAWVALIGVLLMGIAVLIHLVINPTLEHPLHLPEYEGFLAGVVTLYFGLRA